MWPNSDSIIGQIGLSQDLLIQNLNALSNLCGQISAAQFSIFFLIFAYKVGSLTLSLTNSVCLTCARNLKIYMNTDIINIL